MRSSKHASGSFGIEALEPRALLAAAFGPVQSAAVEATSAILADVDDDGHLDRVTSLAQTITLERGVGDGTFGPAVVTTLAGSTLALGSGRYRGPGALPLISSIGVYNTEAGGSTPAGWTVRILGFDGFTGGLSVRARTFVPFTGNLRNLVAPVLMSGDVRASFGDELLVSFSVTGFQINPEASNDVEVPQVPPQPNNVNGRVFAAVLAMPADSRITLQQTLMDRSFRAPQKRFLGPRLQLADVNGDGKTDALVRPVSTWRAELNPTGLGPGRLDTIRQGLPGSDEAAAGGRFVFADITGDGLVDRLLVKTSYTQSSRLDAFMRTTRTTTVLAGVGIERGLGGGSFAARVSQAPVTVFRGVDPVRDPGTFDRLDAQFSGVTLTPSVADIDADGRPDLLITGQMRYLVFQTGGRPLPPSVGFQWFVNVMRQTGTGGFAADTQADTLLESGRVGLTLGDLDEDGRPDLLLAGLAPGTFLQTGVDVGTRFNITAIG